MDTREMDGERRCWAMSGSLSTLMAEDAVDMYGGRARAVKWPDY
jgi:hypothetical protein